MFGLKYLSRERKLLLSKMQDRAANHGDAKIRSEAELTVQQILAEAKPYLECDRQEAQELREQLFNQIRTLEGLGKQQAAESFRMHVREVDFHIERRTMEDAIKEKSRTLHGEPGHRNDDDDPLPSVNGVRLERQRKKAMGRARWTIDMDEDSQE